jgi:CDP-diacylglycerol pyrophosphatase
MSHAAAVGTSWAPFPVPLAGDEYDAIAVDDLAANPFDLLADGLPGARGDMASRTVVVVGAIDRPGFVVLAGRAEPAAGDMGSGEQLQDHSYCAAPIVGK